MKIIKFSAENVKRLKAVEITPDGTMQIVAGRNAQGKSSVLDAIWLALGGGPAARATSRPIRDGEESASVTLDLGDLVVTRTWKGDKTSLTVKSADGAKFSSPQSMLDGLVGRLSFDPLEFTRLSSTEQRDALLALVELPFVPAELDAKRVKLYDQRTEIGRQGKALGEVPAVDKSLPEAERSASALLGRIREAQEVNRRRSDQERDVQSMSDNINETTRQINELTNRRNEQASEFQAAQLRLTEMPEISGLDRMESDLSTVEDTNAAIRANNRARELGAANVKLTTKYNDLTKSIDTLDATKAKGLAAAKFPVDGLGFDDGGVTYQGVPFSQASSAEQIRVSLAMAMSLNPTLRVVRIMDGSLLDADSLALIAEMAAESECQVWIERVGDGDGVGVVIEDGTVQS